jgi:hypothetical protein
VTGCILTALSAGIITSSVMMFVGLKWLNPLRDTVTTYERIMFIQREALAAAANVVDSLLKRSAGMLTCDACDELVEQGDLGCIRDGDRGRILFGHATCFPPMPEPPHEGP